MKKDPFRHFKRVSRIPFLACCIYSSTLYCVNVSTPEELRDQITASNTSGETITFSNDITLTTFPLPAITNDYIIDGAGNNLTGTAAQRGLTVLDAGDITTGPTIRNLRIASGTAVGGSGGDTTDDEAGAGGGGLGAGGGLFLGGVRGIAILENVTFDSCSATGGAGGTIAGVGSDGGGGGGGGLGGDGGIGGAGGDGGGGGGGYITGTAGAGQDAPLSGVGGLGGGVSLGMGVGGGGTGASALTPPTAATTGDYGGGGGGGGDNPGDARPGMGGFAGGGGGGGTSVSSPTMTGADGGYGGGGGGAATDGGIGSGGSGGFGGGSGGDSTIVPLLGGDGGGGAALGGAVFVDGDLTFNKTSGSSIIKTEGTVTGGAGGTGPNPGTDGQGIGTGFFLKSGSSLTLDIGTGITTTLLGGIKSDTLGGGSTVEKKGAGALTLSGSSNINSYDGTTILSAGTLQADADSNFGTSSITMDGGTLEALGMFTLTKDITLNSGTINPATFILTASGTISGGGTLMVTGTTGELILTGTNTYSGGTVVTGTSLQVSSDSNLGSGDLSLDGATLIAGGAFTLSKAVTLTSTCSIDTNSFDMTASGVISGSGSLMKENTGKLTLTGSNTYAGGTSILGGTLSISSNNNLGLAGTSLAIGASTLEATGSFSATRPTSLTAACIFDITSSNSVTMNGAITGAGSLEKTGTGTLVLTGANTYSLGTTVTAGTLSVSSEANLGSGDLTLADGTLEVTGDLSNGRAVMITGDSEIDITGSNSLRFNGVVSGASALTKSGTGTLIIGGGSNTYSGTTTVSAGGMILANGNFGPVTLDANTSLQGVGSIGSLSSSGTVSPGTSVGTISISGPYTQSASATYEAEIAPNGTSDLISATGMATLGGTLSVIPTTDSGLFRAGTQYVILSASSLAGNFETVLIDPSLSAVIELTSTDVLVTLTKPSINFDPTNLSGNTKNIADYIVRCVPDASEDFINVVDSLTALPTKQLKDALLQLSPVQFGALNWVRFENDQRIAALFTDQANRFCHFDCNYHPDQVDASIQSREVRIWFEPVFQWIDQNRQEKQREYDASTYGFIFGANTQIADPAIFGGGLGYTYTDVDWEKNLGDSSMHSFYAALYGTYNFKLGFLESSLVGTRALYKAKRKMHFSDIRRIAKNNHRGWDFTAHLGGGLAIDCSHQFFFQPTVDLDLINVYQEAYEESGAGSISLKVKSQHSTFFRSQIKTQLSREIQFDDWCLTPGFNIGWVHESPLSSSKIGSSYTEKCPGIFKVKTYKRDRDLASFGLHFEALYDCFFSFSTKYQLLMNGKYMENDFSFHLGYHF